MKGKEANQVQVEMKNISKKKLGKKPLTQAKRALPFMSHFKLQAFGEATQCPNSLIGALVLPCEKTEVHKQTEGLRSLFHF